MLESDTTFQCLLDQECFSYTPSSIYCHKFRASAMIQSFKLVQFVFSTNNLAHITLYFAANIQNNLNLAKYNIRYSAECVTFCVYAAGFNSCNKKHTRKIANRCHKQTRMDISYNQCRAPSPAHSMHEGLHRTPPPPRPLASHLLALSPHSTAIEVDCMEYT